VVAVPNIVGIGGTTAEGSSAEQALSIALAHVEALGGRATRIGAAVLKSLPHYDRRALASSETAQKLVEAIRSADGLLIASPSYHGSVSGLVKNALDYLEETARDRRPYLDGLPVGLIITAHGWQATGATLGALRSIVHALRGWPTPYGVGIKSAPALFEDGICSDEAVRHQLELVGGQVFGFCSRGVPQRSSRI
jgi:FMN reductase